MNEKPKHPVLDMARGELIVPLSRRWVRKSLIWAAVFIVLALAVPIVGFLRMLYFFKQQNTAFNAARTAMQKPENFKAAGHYLARLMQSDPAMWKSDWLNNPPDWLPPELGKLDPHYCDVDAQLSVCGGGGGFIDFFGYHLWKVKDESIGSLSTFELSYLGAGSKDVTLDRFTIASDDRIEEDEFVKSAMLELDRRQKAFAAGTQMNLYGDNPLADRQRLLAQHPAIAQKLGLIATTNPAVQQTKKLN
jgi:hypothetical protein